MQFKEFTLNKCYPKYNYKELNDINLMNLEPNKEVHFKITRLSEYGERYKLFVIEKNTFENNFNLEEYGINFVKENDKIVVDTLKWNGLAKKAGFEMGDIISEFKTENLDRPSKFIVYPIAFILLFSQEMYLKLVHLKQEFLYSIQNPTKIYLPLT